jgi:hypothetical protein
MVKRMRLARTLGLAEALDLSEAEALHLREVMAKFDEKRAAFGKQMREARETIRKAARGDQAAQKGLDEALKRTRELRGQAQALADEMFQTVTKDFTPERKAKAALFFQGFGRRMAAHVMHLREQYREMQGPGPWPRNREMRRGPGGGGPRMDMGPGSGGPRMGMGPGAPDVDEPDVEILPDDAAVDGTM